MFWAIIFWLSTWRQFLFEFWQKSWHSSFNGKVVALKRWFNSGLHWSKTPTYTIVTKTPSIENVAWDEERR